jgi:predicted peptidase
MLCSCVLMINIVYHVEMFTTISTAIILLFTHFSPMNSEPSEPTIKHQVIDLKLRIGEQDYAWSIMIPETASKGGAGLLFLHGYGECGIDGEKHLTVGLPAELMKEPGRWPFVVIAPQKPVFNSEWEEHEEAVLAMIDQAIENGYIDADRLAITGLSQGGHGTIMFASKHPDRFAAAAPVCGYVRPIFDKDRQRINHPQATPSTPTFVEMAESIKLMPTWLFHGEVDSVVPVAESRSMHKALINAGNDAKYTELQQVDHNAWDKAYTDPKLAQWLIDHTQE